MILIAIKIGITKMELNFWFGNLFKIQTLNSEKKCLEK